MYADTVTESMRMALSETTRRRVVQEAYNTDTASLRAMESEFDDISLSVYNSITGHLVMRIDKPLSRASSIRAL